MATTPPGSPLGLFHCTVLIRATHTLTVWLEGEYHPANAPQADSPHPAPMSQPGISCPQSRAPPPAEVKISLSLGWGRALFEKCFFSVRLPPRSTSPLPTPTSPTSEQHQCVCVCVCVCVDLSTWPTFLYFSQLLRVDGHGRRSCRTAGSFSPKFQRHGAQGDTRKRRLIQKEMGSQGRQRSVGKRQEEL